MDYCSIHKNFSFSEKHFPRYYKQKNIWGDEEFIPLINSSVNNRITTYFQQTPKNYRHAKIAHYLYKDLIPYNWPVEGKEEMPKLLSYKEDLPVDIVAMDETAPSNCDLLGLHGFCYDSVLIQKIKNWRRVYDKATNFHCAFGPNFSVLMDGRRCEAVEAVRLNRYATLNLQLSGIPTIQTVSFTCIDYFDIVMDGLAPYSPIAFENMCGIKNPHLNELIHKEIDLLIDRKSPSCLLIVGEKLPFKVDIPIFYYKSRIQKLREHEYNK